MVPDPNPTPVPASERLRLLIDAVEEYAIFLVDPSGRIATWNPGARRIKGYDADEVIGEHFSIFYTQEDVDGGKPDRLLAEATERGQARDEGWRVRKDGQQFWANAVVTAVFDDDGKLIGFAKVTRDETDRKRAEENARELELVVDRERIALELHQAVVHRIFDAGLAIQGALSLVNDPVAAGRIQDAVDLLDETLREIRRVVVGLNEE